MAERPDPAPPLCLIGRVARRLGCLPKKFTSPRVYYPITIRPLDDDSDYSYSDDMKYSSGPLPPLPHPGEPTPQMSPYVAAHQYRSSQPPRSPKKAPVAQTVLPSAVSLPAVNASQHYTTTATRATPNPELPTVHSTGQITPLSTSRTFGQRTVPGSVLQDLGNITPTQYTWNTPYGVLTYAPAPTSALLPNPLADLDAGNGDEGPTDPGLIQTPVSSDTSDSSSISSDHVLRSGVALNPFLASNCYLPRETPVEWNVSEPVETARHILGDASFVANAHEPATNPPATTLHIELYLIDQPGVKWNWEPITVRKRRPIRIVDVFHSIHDYFDTQLTHAEYDIIKSHGTENAKIVRDSWRERISSQPEGDARSAVYSGGLRRVDCLGSSKKFAGLWVEESQLKLSLRA